MEIGIKCQRKTSKFEVLLIVIYAGLKNIIFIRGKCALIEAKSKIINHAHRKWYEEQLEGGNNTVRITSLSHPLR